MKVLQQIYHYMHFAMAIYGWPMYLRKNTATATCKLCAALRLVSNKTCSIIKSMLTSILLFSRCSCLTGCPNKPLESVVLEDNCCGCNYAAYSKMLDHLPDTYLVYITYHVDVGETPFLVALDFSQKAVVICIRGTLSLEVSMSITNV